MKLCFMKPQLNPHTNKTHVLSATSRNVAECSIHRGAPTAMIDEGTIIGTTMQVPGKTAQDENRVLVQRVASGEADCTQSSSYHCTPTGFDMTICSNLSAAVSISIRQPSATCSTHPSSTSSSPTLPMIDGHHQSKENIHRVLDVQSHQRYC